MWKKILGFVAVIGVMTFTLAPTSKQGDIQGRFRVATASATLNGTSVVTGTPFRVKDNVGFLSLFYQAIQGSSTPHYAIRVFTAFEPGGSFTTSAVATATPSADETTTDLKHVAVAIPFCDTVRVDIDGIALNAEDTTFNMWIGDQ